MTHISNINLFIENIIIKGTRFILKILGIQQNVKYLIKNKMHLHEMHSNIFNNFKGKMKRNDF